MSRPSIALACILKNEAANISRFLQSVKGCFDEIVMCDTGSTDGSVEFLEKINEKIEAKDPLWSGFPKIKIEHFEWVNDFAAARNYSFSKCATDYICWFDLDDVLSSTDAFINWRDNVLHSAHYWVAVYNYAYNANGAIECQFVRERVIKRNYGFEWRYFVHEGILQTEGRKYWPQRVNTWTVNHLRTEDDRKQDHLRNIKIFEQHDLDKQDPRMKFYYGKELFENGFPEKAGKPLMEAAKDAGLDLHDRILTIQYAVQSAISAKAYPQAIDLLMNGLRIMPNRAEYWCLLGDVYLASNAIDDATLAYKNALNCKPNDLGGALVVHNGAYGDHPRINLANILSNTGNFDGADEYIKVLREKSHHRAQELFVQNERMRDLAVIRENLPKTADVLITCPPQAAVTDWDENTLVDHGHGGSETAAIEVARWIKQKTGRGVKIFQPRTKRDVMPSGVEYVPVSELVGYVHNVEPYAHISWRHSTRLTKAPSFVWCHDLQCPGADKTQNYDKLVALSEFHKQYLIETNGVPADKIVLGFNGINPDDFNVPRGTKDPLKVVFSSSPDRGLVQSIDIVKKAREISGLDIKLHCFYGVANMRKMGAHDWADAIEKKIKDNPFVVYHGMVSKKVLMAHFLESSAWLYPADFIESYCITAIEALAAHTWPIVRRMGALPNTLKPALDRGLCDMLSVEVVDEASTGLWANTLVEAIIDKKWEKMDFKPEDFSWEKVADFFIKEMKL